MSRYIKIHEGIEESPVFAHPSHLKIWVHLLLRANLKPRHANVKAGTGYTQVKVGRGQLIASRASIAERVGLDENFVYRTLEKFVNWQMIEMHVVNNQFTLITISNYDTYNSVKPESEQPVNSHRTGTEQAPNSHRTAGEQPVNTLYEGNEGKEGYEGNELGEGTHTRPAPPDETLPAVIQSGPPANTDAETKKGRRGAAVSTTFQKPQISDVVEFMAQHAEAQVMQGRTTGIEVTAAAEAEAMFNHFEANGWKVGRNPMRDWKAAARNWYARSLQYARERAGRTNTKTGFGEGIAAARIADQILFPNEKP